MPRPISVITLTENTETSVTRLITRTAMNAPTIANPPINSGVAAAASPPKMRINSTRRTGRDRVSAFARSALVCSLAACRNGTLPPVSVTTPGADATSAGSRSSNAAVFSSGPTALSCTAAYVACRLPDTSDGARVSYHVVTLATSGRDRTSVSVAVTGSRNAGSSTVRVGLE